MSYAFKNNSEQEFASGFSEVNVRDNTFDLPSNTYNIEKGDVIHVRYLEGGFKKGVYAVAINTGAGAAFQFDQKIYELTSTVAPANVLGASIYRRSIYTDINGIDFNVSVNRAVYSNEYKAYNVSKDYQVVVSQQRRRFFDDYDDVAYSEKIILADYCENFAYGVSYDEETFALVNNKFSNALAFNVATR